MVSGASRSIRPVADALAAACRLLALLPWVHMVVLAAGDAGLPALMLRVIAVSVAAYTMAQTARALPPLVGSRRLNSILMGTSGVLVAALVFGLPAFRLGLTWPLWLGLGVMAWLTGVALDSFSTDPAAMHLHMISGAISISSSMLLAAHLGFGDEGGSVLLTLAGLWLVTVMVATALVRFAELSERYVGMPVTRFWPPVLGMISVVCIALAVFLGLAAPVVLGLLRTPALALMWLVRAVLTVVAYAVGVVAQVLIWGLQLLVDPSRRADFEMPTLDGTTEFPEVPPPEGLNLPPELLWSLAVAAIVVIGIGLTAWLLLRARARSSELELQESRESFASSSAIRRWAAGRWGLGAGVRSAILQVTRQPQTAVEYYTALLRLAARRGAERAPATTPLEHQVGVHRVLAGVAAETDTILGAFLSEYYGEEPGDEVQRQSLALAWSAVRQWRPERDQRVAEQGPTRA